MKYLKQGGVTFTLFYLLWRGGHKFQRLFFTYFYNLVLPNCKKNCRFGKSVYLDYPKNIFIGNSCIFGDNVSIHSEFDSSICKIEDNVQITNNVSIDYSGDIKIGSNTLISSSVSILTHDHGLNPHSVPQKYSLTEVQT